MANERGDGTSAGQKAPDLLTVSQAAIVMRLGRTTAHALVSRFVETDGAEGIPAVVIAASTGCGARASASNRVHCTVLVGTG